MRALLRTVKRALLHPAILGGAYVLFLAWRASREAGSNERALGEQGRVLTDFVVTKFGSELSRIALALAATAFAFGAVLGIASSWIVRLRDRLARVEPRGTWATARGALLVTIALHAFLELHAIAVSPQLYAEAFYANGGIGRTIEVLATDLLRPLGVTILCIFTLISYLAGPPSKWRQWPPRLARAFLPLRHLGTTHATALILFVLLVVSVPRLRIAEAHGDVPREMNVLLIAADSLRADRITPRTAPNISALASHATRFDRAYVSLPRTFPSWVSYLSGRHPHHHGIRSMFPRWEDRAKDFDTIPERLAKRGYKSAVVSDYAGDIFGRIDLGFGSVATPSFDFRQLVRQRALERETPLLPLLHSRLGRRIFPVLRELNDAADPHMLAEDAIATIDRLRDQNAPFFMTVFFSTTHFPYAAPAPYYARFTDPKYRGRFKYHKPVSLGSEAPPDDADIAQVRGLYDGAVNSIDDAAQEILDALRARGLAERTIVIVTADHGETLYENGHGQGHGDHLFGDEATHVPLIVFDPRKQGGQRVDAIARDVDLAPTIYELTGTPAPTDLDGRSLGPALRGEPLAPAFAYAETGLWFTEDIAGLPSSLRLPYPSLPHLSEIDEEHGSEIVLQKSVKPLVLVAKHRMVRDARYKLVYVPTREGAKYMLFDTARDPGETRDVASDAPNELLRLKPELVRWMLEDHAMTMKNGYLVPRDPSLATAKGSP